MKFSTYRAFGLLFIINEYEPGDVFLVNVPTNPRCITYCVKGRSEVINTDTNQPDRPYLKGTFVDSKNEPPGNYQFTCVESAVVFCYDPAINNNLVLNCERLDLLAGTESTIPKDTKYFLMEGSLTINNTEFTGPSRIHITSGDVSCLANTDCYGLKIK